MAKPNKKNLRKWYRALLSKKFRQTQGALYRKSSKNDPMGRPTGYCCLGVACSIAIKDGVCVPRSWGCRVNLPLSVQTWLGINSGGNPMLNGLSAIQRNDSRGQSFEQIAEAIKKEYDL